jgi:hypothetical protein
MLRPREQWIGEDLWNRDTDPPIQKLLHTVGVLCIDYYEAFQRKKRANSWSDCHSRVEVSRQQQQAQGKKMLGFRARARCTRFSLLESRISNWQFGSRPGSTALLRRAAERIKKAAVRCPRLAQVARGKWHDHGHDI